jgi:hypothetical protein
VLPIFAYLQTASESATFNQAYDILVGQCMARWGFNDPFQVEIGVDMPPMFRRYGITSLAVASRWGYHLQPAANPAASSTAPGSNVANAVLLGTRSREVDPNYSPFGHGPRLKVAGKLVPPGGVRRRSFGATPSVRTRFQPRSAK